MQIGSFPGTRCGGDHALIQEHSQSHTTRCIRRNIVIKIPYEELKKQEIYLNKYPRNSIGQ